MKLKIAFATLGISLLLAAVTTPVVASPATSTGTCFNGATWTLTVTRNADQVTTTITVKPVPPKSKWNINYAFPNSYQVANYAATADSKGVVKSKHTIKSAAPVYALVMVDSWPPVSVTTCVAGGTA